MPKLSGCFGLRPRALRSAIVASSIASGICRRSRGFTVTLSGRREPNIIWNWVSGIEGELVLRPAEDRSLFLADADDAEVGAFDLDDLVQRIDLGAEQPVRGLPADHGDRPGRVDLRRGHEAAAFGVEAREADVIRRHALNVRAGNRAIAIGDAALAGGAGHDRGDERAVVAANRAHVLQGDPRVGPHLVEVFVASGDRDTAGC